MAPTPSPSLQVVSVLGRSALEGIDVEAPEPAVPPSVLLLVTLEDAPPPETLVATVLFAPPAPLEVFVPAEVLVAMLDVVPPAVVPPVVPLSDVLATSLPLSLAAGSALSLLEQADRQVIPVSTNEERLLERLMLLISYYTCSRRAVRDGIEERCSFWDGRVSRAAAVQVKSLAKGGRKLTPAEPAATPRHTGVEPNAGD